jgi:ankyrin repeat protein
MDVNLTQMQNITALLSATKRGNLNLVKLLLEFGADKSLKMTPGETALDIAIQENKMEMVDLLN